MNVKTPLYVVKDIFKDLGNYSVKAGKFLGNKFLKGDISTKVYKVTGTIAIAGIVGATIGYLIAPKNYYGEMLRVIDEHTSLKADLKEEQRRRLIEEEENDLWREDFKEKHSQSLLLEDENISLKAELAKERSSPANLHLKAIGLEAKAEFLYERFQEMKEENDLRRKYSLKPKTDAEIEARKLVEQVDKDIEWMKNFKKSLNK